LRHHRRRRGGGRARRLRETLRRARQAAHRRAAHHRQALGRGGDDGAGRLHRFGPGQGRSGLEEGSAEAPRRAGDDAVTRGRSGSARTVAAALALGGALGVLACATSPYQRAGNADDVAGAVARAHEPAPSGRSVAYLVLAGAAGPRLAAYDLAAARLLWTQPAEVTTRVVAGPKVLIHGDKGSTPNGELVARDVATGAPLWRHPFPSSEHLYGYAIDGDAVYVVTRVEKTPSKQAGALGAYDLGTGAPRWQAALPSARVAGPAARGGLVAVPLESQYVLLFDGATGAVRAADVRLRPLPPRAERILRPRPQPRALAGVGGRRQAAVPRRARLRARLPLLLRLRRQLGGAALGLREPRRRGGLGRHGARHLVRHLQRRAGRARSDHRRADLPGHAAGRGGPRRHLRRRGVRAAARGRRQHAARSAGGADGDHRRPRPAVPGDEAVRHRGAGAAAGPRGDRQADRDPAERQGGAAGGPEGGGDAGGATRRGRPRSPDRRLARARRLRRQARGAAGRGPGPRRGRARAPGAIGGAGARRPPAAAGDHTVRGCGDRQGVGGHRRHRVGPRAARLPDHVPRRSGLRARSDGAGGGGGGAAQAGRDGRSPALAVLGRRGAHRRRPARAPLARAGRDRHGGGPVVPVNVVVCRGPVCGDKRGSAALAEHLRARVAAEGLSARVAVSEEICLGHCLRGPNVLVCDADDPDGLLSPRAVLYNRMTVADLDRVVDRHLKGGLAVRALTNLPPVRDR